MSEMERIISTLVLAKKGINMKIIKGNLLLKKNIIIKTDLKVEGNIISEGGLFDLKVYGNIDCLDIDCRNIDCLDIDCRNIDCQNIDCRNIDCRNIDCQNIDCLDIDCRNIDCQNIDCQNIDCLDIDCQNIDCQNIYTSFIVCESRKKKLKSNKTICRNIITNRSKYVKKEVRPRPAFRLSMPGKSKMVKNMMICKKCKLKFNEKEYEKCPECDYNRNSIITKILNKLVIK